MVHAFLSLCALAEIRRSSSGIIKRCGQDVHQRELAVMRQSGARVS